MLTSPLIEIAKDICLRAHEGQVDKSGVPYYKHPFHLAEQMTTEETVCVALLHDVIEDAGVTYDCIREQFGERVAELVKGESEDKSKTWQERKQATICHMAKASREEKMICLGDKVSNLRSMAADHLAVGDSV